MKIYCDNAMVNYEPVSCRSVLYSLGYHGEDAEQVLQYLYDKGFTYCFDSQFLSATGIPGDDSKEYPSADVCYWGPDQLKSRLDSYAR